MTRYLFLALIALLLTACHSGGAYLGTGIAAGLAALDQMLANGQMDQSQHDALKSALLAAGEGKILSPEGITALVGTAVTSWAATRAQRGKPTQRVGLPQSKVTPT